MVIHLVVNAYHLEQLSCIVKIILYLLQNEWTQINYWKFCFALYLSIRLSLNVDFVHNKSLRYSACQMRT